MPSKIEPRTNLHIADKEFPTGYRLYDDLKGISSGLTVERVKSVMERGGIRLKGASKGVRITDCYFTLKAPQTGSNLPGGVEIQATSHARRVLARKLALGGVVGTALRAEDQEAIEPHPVIDGIGEGSE